MRIAIAVVTLLSCGSARAADEMLPFYLGDLIGSEKACAITFNQDAVARFIASNTKPGDLPFLSRMNDAADTMRSRLEEMPATQKAAHCAQAKRLAQEYGIGA